MKYKILGSTGCKVSILCLGSINYGGQDFYTYMEDLDQKAANEQIKILKGN